MGKVCYVRLPCFTCVGRLVDRFVELNERKQVVVTYANDVMTVEAVGGRDVSGVGGDGEVSVRDGTVNGQCYRNAPTHA